MASNIYNILNTAQEGLRSQLLAMEVTGHNIANVQTEGYSRQEVSFETTIPRFTETGRIGTGVRVGGIDRAHDAFLQLQIMGESDVLGKSRVKKEVYDQIEILLSENSGRSVNKSLSNFFSGIQDVASNPTSPAERSTLLAEGQELVSTFNNLGESLFQIQQNLNTAVSVDISKANNFIKEIAQLNEVIHANEPTTFSANDYRDQRDLKIKKLNEIIDLNYVDENNGQISLTRTDGTPLVLNSTAFTLVTSTNGNNKSFHDVIVQGPEGNDTNITSTINGGTLKGYLEMRDKIVEEVKDKLDRLAAGFVKEFNEIHQQGFGIDGSTGNNFFKALKTTVLTNVNNTGSAKLITTNGDPSNISVDKYEITITGANSFRLNNLTTGFSSGTFTFQQGSSFNLANGYAVEISGTPAVGDKFRLSVSENAARSMSIGSDVLSNTNKISAGLNTRRDGGNALNLIKLQSQLVFDSVTLDSAGSGTFTFDEFYNSLVSTVGVQASASQSNLKQQEGILRQLSIRRESISGVSIDEEMINMIKFQQAYNAAARLISIVDEMMENILVTI
jgi:flagellar hook-associated protein 1